MAGQINLVDLILAIRRAPRALAQRAEQRRHRKRMRKARRYALAELPENTFGKVVGIARPERKQLLEAPLSGRLCVYYEAYVDEMTDNTMLQTLASEQEGIEFVLEDGETRALIDPAHAFMSTGIDHVKTADLFVMSAREEKFATRHGVTIARSQFANGFRFREAIIEADERLAVFGAAVREPDLDANVEAAGYREHNARTRLRFTGTSRFPLFISDDPHALK